MLACGYLVGQSFCLLLSCFTGEETLRKSLAEEGRLLRRPLSRPLPQGEGRRRPVQARQDVRLQRPNPQRLTVQPDLGRFVAQGLVQVFGGFVDAVDGQQFGI